MPVVVPANHVSTGSPAHTASPEDSVQQHERDLSISVSSNLDLRDIRKQIQSGAQAKVLSTHASSSLTAGNDPGTAQQEKDVQPKSGTVRPQGNDWEAKNTFAAGSVGLSSVAGMNPGYVTLTPKPEDMPGVAAGVSISHESVRYANARAGLSAESRVVNNTGDVTRLAGSELLKTVVRMFTDNSPGQGAKTLLEQPLDLTQNEAIGTGSVSVVRAAEEDISEGRHVVISDREDLAISSIVSGPERQNEAEISTEGLAIGVQRSERPVIGKMRQALHFILRGGRD